MSGHTPGPWWFSRVHGTTYIEARLVSDRRLLQEVAACGPTFTPGEQQFNALLISYAPDLLESLQEVVAVADRDTDVFIRAKDLIAKATGLAALSQPATQQGE